MNVSPEPSKGPLPLPYGLAFNISSIPGAGVGVFATRVLNKGLLFGPFEGDVLFLEDNRPDAGLTFVVSKTTENCRNGEKYYWKSRVGVDSQWMRFVKYSPTEADCNMVAFQQDDKVLFTTVKPILDKEEIFLQFSDKAPAFIKDDAETWTNYSQETSKRYQSHHSKLREHFTLTDTALSLSPSGVSGGEMGSSILPSSELYYTYAAAYDKSLYLQMLAGNIVPLPWSYSVGGAAPPLPSQTVATGPPPASKFISNSSNGVASRGNSRCLYTSANTVAVSSTAPSPGVVTVPIKNTPPDPGVNTGSTASDEKPLNLSLHSQKNSSKISSGEREGARNGGTLPLVRSPHATHATHSQTLLGRPDLYPLSHETECDLSPRDSRVKPSSPHGRHDNGPLVSPRSTRLIDNVSHGSDVSVHSAIQHSVPSAPHSRTGTPGNDNNVYINGFKSSHTSSAGEHHTPDPPDPLRRTPDPLDPLRRTPDPSPDVTSDEIANTSAPPSTGEEKTPADDDMLIPVPAHIFQDWEFFPLLQLSLNNPKHGHLLLENARMKKRKSENQELDGEFSDDPDSPPPPLTPRPGVKRSKTNNNNNNKTVADNSDTLSGADKCPNVTVPLPDDPDERGGETSPCPDGWERDTSPLSPGMLSCYYCHMRFHSSSELSRHLRCHRAKPPPNSSNTSLESKQKLFVCSWCGINCTDSGGLEAHMDTNHRSNRGVIDDHMIKTEPQDDPPAGVEGTGGDQTCGYCGRHFARAAGLKTHLRSHTGERPYKCKQCPEAFLWSVDLHRHESTHALDKPHCRTCFKVFPDTQILHEHVKVHMSKD